MKKNAIKIIGAMIVFVLVLGGAFVVYHNVYAQAPTPQAPGQPGMRGGPRGGMMNNDSGQALATALGIDLSKLQAAYKSANAEALKEAVSKGLITQQQADQMTARGAGRFPMGNFGRNGSNGIDYNALLAKALGISTEKLQTAQQQVFNSNLDALVKSGKLTQDQADLAKAREALANNAKFQASLQSAYAAAVNQAVTDGVITQAQADQILKSQPGMGFPGNFGGFGSPGGFNGPWSFNKSGQNGPFQHGKGATPQAPLPTPTTGA